MGIVISNCFYKLVIHVSIVDGILTCKMTRTVIGMVTTFIYMTIPDFDTHSVVLNDNIPISYNCGNIACRNTRNVCYFNYAYDNRHS